MHSSANFAVNGRGFLRCVDKSKQYVAIVRYLLAFGSFVWSIPMMDVVMVAIAFTFFAVSIAYVYACERL
jgi:hypothetical protein